MRKCSFSSSWCVHGLALVALVLAVFSMPKPVYATPSVGSAVQSTTAIINRIINTTPGLNTMTTTGTGVTVRAAGSTAVNVGRGLTLPIPTAAEASVTAGRLAGLAGRAIRVGSFVGLATMVAPWLLEQSGYKVCPPPDFFCKPGPEVPADQTAGGWYVLDSSRGAIYGNTADDACKKWGALNGYGNTLYYQVNGPSGEACYSPGGLSRTGIRYSDPTCPAGTRKVNVPGYTTLWQCVKSGPDVPTTESDIATGVETAITGNPTRVGQLYGGATSANLPVFAPGDPVTITAPPVTAPPTTRTETVTNPDGSTSTVKTETKTEVKPVQVGSTLGGSSVSYPTTTTTTTTTTNNTTNVTTVNTTVNNNYGTEAATQPNALPDVKPPVLPDVNDPSTLPGSGSGSGVQIPTDYNREVTQQKILDKVTAGFGEITAKPPTGDAELDAIKGQNDKGVSAVDGITADSTGLKAWFPTIPTAQCVNPQVPNPISGVMAAVPICDKVDMFRAFISGVICVFALFGCVREVQSALKA